MHRSIRLTSSEVFRNLRKYIFILFNLLLILIVSSDFAEADLTSHNVSARDILNKIMSGQPVEYDHVTIIGDLDLSQPDLSISEGMLHEIKALRPSEKLILVNSSIRLNDSLIEGSVYLNNTIFENLVNFNGTEFNRSVYFLKSRFNGPSFFRASKFNEPTCFKDSKFIVSTSFRYSTFNRRADFRHSEFNGSADFSHLISNDFADFWAAEFNGPAYFSSSKFSKSNYSDSKFNDRALFWGSRFNSNSYFKKVEFNLEADFLDSIFDETADFTGSKFNCIANFESSKFNNIASFKSTQFDKDAFFIGAQIKSLDLSLAKYEKLYLRWGSIGDLVYHVNYGDTTYELLMANFRNMGFFSDFDNCYYRFRLEQFSHRDFLADPLGYLLDLGAWVFYGFGKKPLYPLAWSIGIMLAFGAIWGIIGMRTNEITTDEYSHPQDQIFDKRPSNRSMWDKIYLVLKSFIFSTTIFLSGTKLFVDPPDVPEITGLPNSLITGIFTLERVLGALFFILFFLTLGATVVRQ
jgi:hypothetical protein